MQVNYDTCKSTQEYEASYDNEVKKDQAECGPA